MLFFGAIKLKPSIQIRSKKHSKLTQVYLWHFLTLVPVYCSLHHAVCMSIHSSSSPKFPEQSSPWRTWTQFSSLKRLVMLMASRFPICRRNAPGTCLFTMKVGRWGHRPTLNEWFHWHNSWWSALGEVPKIDNTRDYRTNTKACIYKEFYISLCYSIINPSLYISLPISCMYNRQNSSRITSSILRCIMYTGLGFTGNFTCLCWYDAKNALLSLFTVHHLIKQSLKMTHW